MGAPDESRLRTVAPWILVVDDAPLTRLVIRDILELHGYEVQAAANGAIALQLLDPEPPVLVVLDMRMPAMDGWEFARELRSRGLAIPILVIAAAPEAAGWAREIGAAGWLGKPFRLGDLLAAVARLRPSPDDPAGPAGPSPREQDR